ncbi:MAG: hypothetical protein EZS28_010249, partial [Streblomastix strix]
VEFIHWWSDGGPHFRNKQLIWSLLNETDPLLPGFEFEINYKVPYHGKGEPDGVFGFYSQGLNNNMPQEGINSLDSLAKFLKLLSVHQAKVQNDVTKEHEILILNFDRFDDEADFLVIEGFKKFLSFVSVEGKIKARPLTGISDIGEKTFEMISDTKDVKRTPKRSTISIIDP